MSTSYADPLLRRAAEQLAARRDDIDRRLHAAVLAATGARVATDVQDRKDMAADVSDAALTDAELAHLAHERNEVLAALRRIEKGTWGVCASCGEAIPALRLEALPSAALCTACQAAREAGLAR